MSSVDIALGQPCILLAILEQIPPILFNWAAFEPDSPLEDVDFLDEVHSLDEVHREHLSFWTNLRLVSRQWNALLMRTDQSGIRNVISYWMRTYEHTMVHFPHVFSFKHVVASTWFNHYLDDSDEPRPVFEWFFFSSVLYSEISATAVIFYDTYLAGCDSFKMDPTVVDDATCTYFSNIILRFFESLPERDLIAFLRRWLCTETSKLSYGSFEYILTDYHFRNFYKAFCYVVHPDEKHANLDKIFDEHRLDFLCYSAVKDSNAWNDSVASFAKGMLIGSSSP